MNPKKTYTFKRYFKNKIYVGIFSFSLIFVILSVSLMLWKFRNELPVFVFIFGCLLLFLEWYFFREKGKCDEVFDYNENTWGKGAKGETAVFELLNQQLNSSEYHIFNDFKLEKQKGNIDVVVVGPTGIFAIEVKNWPGKISYNNKGLYRKDKYNKNRTLSQTYAGKLFLENFLKEQLGQTYEARGLLVFSDGFVDKSAQGLIQGVYLDHVNYLVRRIKSFPQSLSAEEIGKIIRIISNAYKDGNI